MVGARRWKVARTGVEPLRALHTAGEAREASECIHIAIGEVTPSAREFAAKHRTRVLGGPDLVRLLDVARRVEALARPRPRWAMRRGQSRRSTEPSAASW